MTSTERILEYGNVKEEALSITDQRPPANWPSKGTVEFTDVFMKYRPDLPYVLTKFSISIESCSKIGNYKYNTT